MSAFFFIKEDTIYSNTTGKSVLWSGVKHYLYLPRIVTVQTSVKRQLMTKVVSVSASRRFRNARVPWDKGILTVSTRILPFCSSLRQGYGYMQTISSSNIDLCISHHLFQCQGQYFAHSRHSKIFLKKLESAINDDIFIPTLTTITSWRIKFKNTSHSYEQQLINTLALCILQEKSAQIISRNLQNYFSEIRKEFGIQSQIDKDRSSPRFEWQ